MKTLLSSILWALMISGGVSEALAHATYTGYSGAPGSNGQCAASCHGSSGGTIQVTGFPASYVGGQMYTVSIDHSGGSAIRQFNGSCRLGTGSANAGTIAAGTATVTYNTAGETNGVHLTAVDQNSATFLWTAPAAGAGNVVLYIAGHQGSSSGPNTTLVLTATEQASAVGDGSAYGQATELLLRDSSPNPFRGETVIGYVLARAALVHLEIFDCTGRELRSMESQEPAGYHQFTWNASGQPSGIYYYRIQAGTDSGTRALLLLK